MRHGSSPHARRRVALVAGVVMAGAAAKLWLLSALLQAAHAAPAPAAPSTAPAAAASAEAGRAAAASCSKPVYLTFDTGHMEVAPLIAEVLQRQGVKATFFLANERTKAGGSSLDDTWAPWWKARAAEGHAFGSHTWDHDSWLADTPAGLRVKPSQGPQAGQPRVLDSGAYCRELARPAERFQAMTGQPMAAIFRAPGGKTSPVLLEMARSCGWTHVGWAPAGFLGDELPSDRFPNEVLLNNALRDIRAGDVLVAHLGIWSRRDAWAPAVLEPLITGLKARGLCFATLREHPQLGAAARQPAPAAARQPAAPGVPSQAATPR